MDRDKKFTCPCCGYMVHSEPPGSYEICPICFWEDDLTQLRFMETGGANQVSLIEGQRNFKTFGACDDRMKNQVRRPNAEDRLDESWRSFDINSDYIERAIPGKDYGSDYPKDSTEFYYWRVDRRSNKAS